MMLQLGSPIDAGNCVFKQSGPFRFLLCYVLRAWFSPVHPEILLGILHFKVVQRRQPLKQHYL